MLACYQCGDHVHLTDVVMGYHAKGQCGPVYEIDPDQTVDPERVHGRYSDWTHCSLSIYDKKNPPDYTYEPEAITCPWCIYRAEESSFVGLHHTRPKPKLEDPRRVDKGRYVWSTQLYRPNKHGPDSYPYGKQPLCGHAHTSPLTARSCMTKIEAGLKASYLQQTRGYRVKVQAFTVHSDPVNGERVFTEAHPSKEVAREATLAQARKWGMAV